MNESRTHRSGVNRMFLWMGVALVVVAVLLFGAVPVLGWSLTRSPALLGMLLGLPVFGLAGAVMALVGARRRVLVGPDRVTWYGVLGAPSVVLFSEVAHVEVPSGRRGPRAVALHRRDGRVQVIGALAMFSGEGGNSADGAYREAASDLVASHARWWALARGPQQGRTPGRR